MLWGTGSGDSDPQPLTAMQQINKPALKEVAQRIELLQSELEQLKQEKASLQERLEGVQKQLHAAVIEHEDLFSSAEVIRFGHGREERLGHVVILRQSPSGQLTVRRRGYLSAPERKFRLTGHNVFTYKFVEVGVKHSYAGLVRLNAPQEFLAKAIAAQKK